jgi:hypothetical protein
MSPALLLAAVLGCSSQEGDPVTRLMTASVPPIDAAAPAKVETVTFAVG